MLLVGCYQPVTCTLILNSPSSCLGSLLYVFIPPPPQASEAGFGIARLRTYVRVCMHVFVCVCVTTLQQTESQTPLNAFLLRDWCWRELSSVADKLETRTT